MSSFFPDKDKQPQIHVITCKDTNPCQGTVIQGQQPAMQTFHPMGPMPKEQVANPAPQMAQIDPNLLAALLSKFPPELLSAMQRGDRVVMDKGEEQQKGTGDQQ
uniref:STI1 domain-containing protein n=1 Tax=Caenorhabditis tropicalis TaxID=1561998 RepID=A0A1I7V1K3_9PELO